jgi:hypothetical protein
MADDPINIVVIDGVDPSIANKLLAIADASDKSSANIDRLKASLASIRGDNLSTLRDQANTATTAINAELNATKTLGTGLAETSAKAAVLNAETTAGVAASKAATAALAEQALATKALKEAQNIPTIINTGGVALGAAGTAQAATTYAEQQAATTAAREAAAKGAAEMAFLSTASKQAGTAVKGAEAAVVEIGVAAPSMFTKFKTAGVGAFDAVRDAVSGNGSRFGPATAEIVKGAEAAGGGLQKLTGHTINTSTALREMLVLAREGSRGDLTRMAGSASILASAVGLLPIALGAAAVAFGLFYEERKKLNTQTEQDSLKAYAESLGLTEKEMRKLSNTTVDAKGNLKEHNVLMVTYGDTIKGFIETVKQGLTGLFAGISNVDPVIKSAASSILSFLRLAFVGFSGLVLTLVQVIETALVDAAKSVINTVLAIANGAIMGVQALINGVIAGINLLVSGANIISKAAGFGEIATQINKVDLGVSSLTQNMQKLDRPDMGSMLRSNILKTDATLKGFSASWDANTLAASKARIANLAAAEIANRNPKAAKKQAADDTRLDPLDAAMNKAENDAIVMRTTLTKEDAAIQKELIDVRQAQIAQQKGPLSAAQEQEIDNLKRLLVANAAEKKVKDEMRKVYEGIIKPQQDFAIGQAALNRLLAEGTIDLVHYNQEMVKLTRSHEEAINPLQKMREQLTDQAKGIGLYGDAVDTFVESEKIRQVLLAKGIVLDKNATAAQIAEAKAVLALAQANKQAEYVTGQVKAIVDPLLADKKMLANKRALYDEVEKFRKQDVNNESIANQAKHALDAKFNELKLKGATDTLDALTGLSASKNKILAGIGKAAAVADATIKGYQAVQNALASVPPPFNIAAAAATAIVTGVQVANIISTPVGNYWSGGDFIVRGKTGVDANRISMNVSDGERVTIQTQAQQQANANDNSKSVPSSATHVNNFFDEKTFLAAMDTQAGEKVVMNIIQRRKKEVGGIIK